MAKKAPKSEKDNIFVGGVLSKEDVPAKRGRANGRDWPALFADLQPGQAREIDMKKVSKTTLISALHGKGYKVATRTQTDGSIRVFVLKPE